MHFRLGMMIAFAVFVAGCEDLFAECSTDSDCDDDVCVDGACVECDSDSDCEDDDVCEDNECESPECEDDIDCPVDEICDDGRCEGSEGEGEAGEGEGENVPDPEGPRILELSTSSSVLFEDSFLIVSVVVTDPDGIEDVIGGELLARPGGQTYGAFETSASEGAYEATLDWSLLTAVAPIDIDDGSDATRLLRARFFDQAGHEVVEDFEVSLQCRSNGPACDGSCGSGRCAGTCRALDTVDNCGACDNVCGGFTGCASGADGFFCSGPEEDDDSCADGDDNDGDGFTDCDDFDCAPPLVTVCGAASLENTNALCEDGVDNDGDDFTDCQDFDCSQNVDVTVCPSIPEVNDSLCSDGTSNDSDNFIDCDDFDCSFNLDVAVCGTTTCGSDLGSLMGNSVRTATLTGVNRSVGSCGGDGPDQAMRWTAPFSGTFTFDTFGSTVPTILYARTSCGDDFDLACSNDTFIGQPAVISLTLEAGQQIFLAADTNFGETGAFTLNIQ